MLSLLLSVLVNFSWQAPTQGPAPTGYKVVLGDASATKTTVLDAGNKTTFSADVDLSKVKYIAVKSYNQWGESPESTEVVVGKPSVVSNFQVTP